MNIIMGVDPGLSGGIAFLTDEDVSLYPTPVVEVEFVKAGKKKKRKEMDLKLLVDIIKENKPSKAFLEKVTARPGQGVTSMFRFGQNFGQYEATLIALGIELHYINPNPWKKHFGLPSEKDASTNLALELWPEHEKVLKLKKNNGQAEAALIARYGYDSGQ